MMLCSLLINERNTCTTTVVKRRTQLLRTAIDNYLTARDWQLLATAYTVAAYSSVLMLHYHRITTVL